LKNKKVKSEKNNNKPTKKNSLTPEQKNILFLINKLKEIKLIIL